MKRGAQAIRVGYFGKIAVHSDFIKAADNLALAALLDQWLAETMNLLTAEPRWKLHYDALQPLSFAFVGTRSRRAIAGHVRASADRSQRRYPFLAMSALEVDDPVTFLPRSPLVLAGLWRQLDPLAGDVLAAADPQAALQRLAGTVVELDPGDAAHEADFMHFLDSHDVDALQALLDQAPVRQMLLALGLLLRPVCGDGQVLLERSLALPLPGDGRYRYLVAAFWLDLIAPFLRQADVELAVFFACQNGRPLLVVGFRGAAPETLRAIIDPQCADEQQVRLDQADWVDEQLTGERKVQQLSVYLEQGRLSLRSAHALFHDTFA